MVEALKERENLHSHHSENELFLLLAITYFSFTNGILEQRSKM